MQTTPQHCRCLSPRDRHALGAVLLLAVMLTACRGVDARRMPGGMASRRPLLDRSRDSMVRQVDYVQSFDDPTGDDARAAELFEPDSAECVVEDGASESSYGLESYEGDGSANELSAQDAMLRNVPPDPPLPQVPLGAWTPPGIIPPWPHDEWLCDGEDAPPNVIVEPDWTIAGLDTEDTIAHFDTVDGRTLVEPSTRVCLYAPRFRAVRSVSSLYLDEQVAGPLGLGAPLPPRQVDEQQAAVSHLQRVESRGQIGLKSPSAYLTPVGDGLISTSLGPLSFDDTYLPFENLGIIRDGVFDQNEKPQLATAIDAAIVWTKDEGVQVAIERQLASEVVGDRRAECTFVYDDIPGHPRLRVVKVASTQVAQPGDVVDFTIRFDNVGDETIGNVTIVDNLTTRLEYVEGSAQSSREGDFSTSPNHAHSLILRWEIRDPMKAGDGGVVRFQCRVR